MKVKLKNFKYVLDYDENTACKAKGLFIAMVTADSLFCGTVAKASQRSHVQ